MINLLVVIIVGAIIGWVASMIMRTRGGLLVDIVVGIMGALLAGYFGKVNLTTGNFTIRLCCGRCWAPSSCSSAAL